MKKTEWECIDLRCTHFDGDMCMHSGESCEPDSLPVKKEESCNHTAWMQTLTGEAVCANSKCSWHELKGK